jgi:uncharacterized membrane protein YfcA
MKVAAFLTLGLAAGIVGGMFGIGGGLVIVPALLYLFNFKQLEAIGTSSAAQVPPATLLAAVEYYREGYVDLRAAALIAAGLFVGNFFGPRIMISLDPATAKRAYAVFLLVMSLRWLIWAK